MGLSEFQLNKKIQTPFSVWAQARANPNHMTPPTHTQKNTITSILLLKSSNTSLCRLTLFGSERKAKQAWCFWSLNINCGLSTNKHDNVTKKTKQDMLLSFSPITNHTFCLFKTSNAQLQVSKTDTACTIHTKCYSIFMANTCKRLALSFADNFPNDWCHQEEKVCRETDTSHIPMSSPHSFPQWFSNSATGVAVHTLLGA